jgi:cytidylate kinase
VSGVPAPSTPTPADLVRVVALDGPAGSGKTTVARRVAAALRWRFVDTGATYRAATLAALRAGIDVQDHAALLAVVRGADIELRTDPAASGICLDGEDVSTQIRGPEVTGLVSAVSAVPAVREQLIAVQRRAMGRDGAVVEGRDIATVVAPHAAVKVYLDAEESVRSRRRAGELVTPGVSLEDLEAAVATAIATRDALDSQTNPLRVSDGAIHLDTTELSVEQVTDVVVRLARSAGVAP